MLVEAGHFALALALGLSLIQFVVPLWGARSNDPVLMAVAPAAALAVLACLAFALEESGEYAMAERYGRRAVERTEADHASLRALALAARGGRRDGLVAFAERLTDHVRFEERELFPCCEARLPAAVLDAVEQRR